MNECQPILKVLICILIASICLSAAISKADHVEPEIETQVNKRTDLFEKSIEDLPNFTSKIEQGKQEGIESLGEKGGTPEGLQFITEKSKSELQGESSKLESIHEHDLTSRGREEMIKSDSLNELYVDYTRPLYKQNMQDAKIIRAKHDEFMDNIFGELKDKLGVDCKTIKGDKKIEPEYFLQIKKTQTKDTVYNQTFCEELRNQYSCNDTATLRCTRRGIRWHPWEYREVDIPGDTVFHRADPLGLCYAIKWKKKRFGLHIHQNSAGWRVFLSNHLNIPIEKIGEQISFPFANRGVGRSTHWVKHKLAAFDTYRLGYNYRDSYEVCEEWSEDWNETCRLK